jgi:hypothetical protein
MSDLTDKMITAGAMKIAMHWGVAKPSASHTKEARAAIAAALDVLAEEGYSLAYREEPSSRAKAGHITYPNPVVLAREIQERS